MMKTFLRTFEEDDRRVLWKQTSGSVLLQTPCRLTDAPQERKARVRNRFIVQEAAALQELDRRRGKRRIAGHDGLAAEIAGGWLGPEPQLGYEGNAPGLDGEGEGEGGEVGAMEGSLH